MAKARDFERLSIDQHQDDAELCADGNRLRKNTLQIFGPRAGGDVVILRRLVEQHVAHATAGEKGFIAFLAQTLNDKPGFIL